MGIRLANGKLRRRGAGLALVLAASSGGSTPGPTDSGVVTLSESSLVDYQIFQRVGTSRAIPVSGTVTLADGAIEARAVDATTGSAVTSWATVATSSGGSFSGSLTVPQGGWCKLEVRKASNPTGITQGTKRFGVGAWVVLAGQSNMEHLWTSYRQSYPYYLLSGSKVRGIKANNNGTVTAYGRIGNYNDAYPAGTSFGDYSSYQTGPADGGDGVIVFANQLASSLGFVIGIAEVAIGGTSIEEWQPGQPRWNGMIAALDAVGGDCELMLFYQGENNAGNTASAYGAKIAPIHNGMLTKTGRTTDTFGFGMVTLGPTATYGAEGTFGEIRKAQIAYLANAGTFLAGVAGDSSSPSNDDVHIDNDSQQRMGRRYAKAVAAYLAGSPKPGPKIASASRSGATVTVAITGNTGALKDGAGGSGASLAGFRVFNNGTAVSISSTAISGNNVVLTLASTPTGTVTLDYGMLNAPYGTTTPSASAILYDSDTVPGDTRGLPLQPCAAITVS